MWVTPWLCLFIIPLGHPEKTSLNPCPPPMPPKARFWAIKPMRWRGGARFMSFFDNCRQEQDVPEADRWQSEVRARDVPHPGRNRDKLAKHQCLRAPPAHY